MKRIFSSLLALTLLLALALTGCGQRAGGQQQNATGPDWSTLEQTGSMQLDYAQQFSVDYYGDYALISIPDDQSRYLLVPEGEGIPKGLEEDITVLCQPLDNLYLVASASMDMFLAADALTSIRFVGLDQDGWYLPGVKEALQAGDLVYAGKYSAPDYELICADGCDLAIENTMIYHDPSIREELEHLGIPVMVDHSSYESDPLGRMEWVKLYGLLTGHLDQAEQAFAEQEQAFSQLNEVSTGKTVAFFYLNTNGAAVVRRSTDYVAKLIEIAGGEYAFPELAAEDGSHSSTTTIQMESFYMTAKDADYIIYNSSIMGEMNTLEDLLAKNELFANFRAVQEGHVYCTTENLYQSSMQLGTFVQDLNAMLSDQSGEMTFLYPLE